MKNQEIYDLLTKDPLAKRWIDASMWGSISWHVCTKENSWNKNPGDQYYLDEKNKFRKNFKLEDDEVMIYCRDTSFWNNMNQGCVITNYGIRVITDNDHPNIIFIAWDDIEKVDDINHKKGVTYFGHFGFGIKLDLKKNHPLSIYEYYLLDIDYFVRESYTDNTSSINLDLEKLFIKIVDALKGNNDSVSDLLKLISSGRKEDALKKALEIRHQAGCIPVYKLIAQILFEKKEYQKVIDLQSEINTFNYKFDKEEDTILFNSYVADSFSFLGNYIAARSIYSKYNHINQRIVVDGQNMRDYFQNRYKQMTLEHSQKLLTLPYRERKVVMITSEHGVETPFGNIAVFSHNDVQNLDFPIGHPKEKGIYVGHPLIPSKYLPIETYQLDLLEDKIREFCILAQGLGATDITIECLNSSEKNDYIKQTTDGAVAVDYSFSAKISRHSENTKNILDELSKTMSLHQTFSPTHAPIVPENLIWFSSEPSWQRLVYQRRDRSLTSHEERIETKKSQMLESNELENIKLEVKNMFVSANIEYSSNIESKLEQKENAVLAIKVQFA